MIESRFVIPLNIEFIKTKKFKGKIDINHLQFGFKEDKDIVFKKLIN